MSASIAIQVLPQVGSDEEVCRIVDEVIACIKNIGLRYEVGPLETVIEGENFDQLMELAAECQKTAVRAGAPKVISYIKVIYKPEGEILTIDQKIGKYREGEAQ